MQIADRRIDEWRLAIDELSIGDWRVDRSNCVPSNWFRDAGAKIGRNSLGALPAVARAMHPKTIELQARTQRFAAAVIRFCDGLSTDAATQRIVLQLVDSSGAVDSNYRATCRARSKAEFIAKIGVALEEADESKGWLQLLVASNRTSIERARDLIQEADELISIFVTSRKTAERRKAERDREEKQLRGTSPRRPK